MRQRGFTLIEILVVIAIIASIAGMSAVYWASANRERIKLECTAHVHELTGLLETASPGRYPGLSGPALLMFLVQRGDIRGKDALDNLFCPGDLNESLADAGGEKAYEGIDARKKEDYGHLTSYAARAQSDPKCRVSKASMPPQVMIADDSDDHHDGRGIVVGLTGGTVKFRSKVDDYGISRDTTLTVGNGSAAPELACLRR